MDDQGAANGKLPHRSIKLKTNDFHIDLEKARIYKYTIKFLPNDIASKEKKFLAQKFLTRLKWSRKSRTVIQNDNFELYLPDEEPELEKAFIQVVCVRQTDYFDGAVSTYLHGKKTYTKFLTDQLITRPLGQKPFLTDSSTSDHSLQLYTVETTKEKIDVGSISTSPPRGQIDQSLLARQKGVLRVLDGILQQQARDTSSVQVHGNRIWDVVGEPAMEGPLIELRRGLIAETRVVNGSAIRRITPCLRFFLKSMKLSELLRMLSSTEPGTGPSLDMEHISHVLKGVKVKKIYGKQNVVQIVGFAAGNADQETFYWNNHKTTTVSHYMEKVYHAENVNEYPEQRCVVVESLERKEILPSNLCLVLPGQSLPLPASSNYFQDSDKQGLLSVLRDVPNSYVSETDGMFTKLLKGSVSPTIGAEYGVKVSGVEERSICGPQNSEHGHRVVEGKVLERTITAGEKNPKLLRNLILLSFGSSNLGNLKKAFSTAFGLHAQVVATRVSTDEHNHDQCHVTIGQLVKDAQEQVIKDAQGRLSKDTSDSEQLKPAIVGIFCKPKGPGRSQSIPQQNVELERLQSTYKAVRRYCHKEGYPFAGTFLAHAVGPPDKRKVVSIVSNSLRKLKTQIDSANGPRSLGLVAAHPRKTLLLGIHVAALQAQRPEQSTATMQQAAGWYVVSIVAKWSGSDAFHRAQTFLQKSSNSKEDRNCTFPGVLATASEGENAVNELVKPASLTDSSIIVFRAGVEPGTTDSEKDSKEEPIVADKAAKPIENQAAESAARKYRSGTRSPAKTAGWNAAAATGTLVENPSSPKPKNEGQTASSEFTRSTVSEADNDSSSGRSVRITKHVTTEGTSPERLSEEHAASTDTTANPEVRAFVAFAKAQKARLVYVQVNSRTRARLFAQESESLVDSSTRIGKQGKGTKSVATNLFAGNMASTSTAATEPAATDLLIQKKLPKKAGPNTPLHLKLLHSTDKELPLDSSSVDALSESSWDFPAGTWSSKNLSCITLAKKASKHAMRIVEFDSGEPRLPEAHADLRAGLFFI